MGQYVCSSGHILEGYHEEESEFQEGAGYERKKKKRKVVKAIKEGVAQGHDATTLILRCVQFILQLQAQALVRDLGFPQEITGVIQEYWTVHVSMLLEYQDELKVMAASENEEVTETEFKDKTEPATPSKDVLDTAPEYQPTESESSDDNDDNDDDNDSDGEEMKRSEDDSDNDDGETVKHGATPHTDDESEATQVTASAGADDMDDVEEYEAQELPDPIQKFKQYRQAKTLTNGRLTDRRRGVLNNRGRTDYRFLSMRFNIAILYIASLHLKIPVVIGDFQRWIMRHDIPFFNAIKYLPEHMEKKLLPGYKHFLQPFSRNPERLRMAVDVLLQHYQKWHSIDSVLPNAPRLIARFIHELMLPVECYTCALRIYHIVYNDLDSRYARNTLTFRSTLRGPDYAMAITVVVAKLIFGLYDENRNVNDWKYWINSLPTEKEWFSSLDSFDAVRTQSEIPHMQAEFEELINVNPDLYSKHYGKELRMIDKEDYTERLGLLSVFDATFKTTGSSGMSALNAAGGQQSQRTGGQQRHKPTKQQRSLEVPYIQRLYSEAKPASHLAVETGPLPQQTFVHYLEDPKGQFMGQYGRLLGYASNILCITPEELEKEVRFIEKQLIVGK
ncbi:Pol I core factor CF [Mortierella sp. AD032]|nr:Pol I core factor CF [Mortierella sp. AD032]